MPVALLHSQLAILEPLAEDENGLVLDIQLPVDELVESVQLALATQEGSSWATTDESSR
jgi:gluconokinase